MANGHGGKRPGSGPKPGNGKRFTAAAEVLDDSRVKQAAIIGDAEFCGIKINDFTPLEVMILGMKLALVDQDINKACERAQICAGYLHPKLQSQEVVSKVTNVYEGKTADELAESVFGFLPKPTVKATSGADVSAN
jgi:hypothetical protein